MVSRDKYWLLLRSWRKRRLSGLVSCIFIIISSHIVLAEGESEKSGESIRAAKLTVRHARPAGFDEANGWINVPQFLSSKKIYSEISGEQPSGDASPQTECEFTVDREGIVLLAASWDYDGRITRQWYDSRATRGDMLKAGWEPIAWIDRVVDKEVNTQQKYVILRRNIRAGESFTLHTRNSASPFVIEIDDDAARSAARSPRLSFISEIYARPDDGKQVALRGGTHKIVALDSLEPVDKWGLSVTGILHREIVRQAFLISARDELALATRDSTLRERFPQIKDVSQPVLEILTASDYKSYFFSVFQHTLGGKRQLLWEEILPISSGDRTKDLVELIAQSESWANSTFVKLIESVGYEGEANEYVDDFPVPEQIIKLQQQLDVISQFAAIRGLHQEIRKHGESPQLLGALVRGYSNLGVATEFHNSPAHKAFKARALVYGTRLVRKESASIWSQWNLAYAFTLAGMHSTALKTIAQIDEDQKQLRRDNSDLQNEFGNNTPAWAEVIRAFCNYDADKLEEYCQTGQELTLARFLYLTTVEHCGYFRPIAEASQNLIEASQYCLRALHSISQLQALRYNRVAVQLGNQVFPRRLHERLRNVPALVSSVDDAIHDYEEELGNDLQEIEARAELIEKLKSFGDNQADRAEPSLAVLGQLIEEVNFTLAFWSIYFESERLGVNSDTTFNDLNSLIKNHPYYHYLGRFVANHREANQSMEALIRRLDPTQIDVHCAALMSGIYRDQRAVWQSIVPRVRAHSDEVYHDCYHLAYRTNNPKNELMSLISRLNEVSPNLPFPKARLIFQDRSLKENVVEAWSKKYVKSPGVMISIAKYYGRSGNWDRAEELCQRVVQLAPEVKSYDHLAGFYLQQGEREKWRTTYDECLSKTSPTGLDHANIRLKLATYLMDQKKWEEALPYSESAAETWSGWGILCAQKNYEGLKRWDDAEVMVRRVSERYRNSSMEWYYWCKRTGHGDVEAARQHAFEYLSSLGSPLPPQYLYQVGVYYLLEGEKEKALAVYEEALRQSPRNSTYQLFVALLLDHFGRTEPRDKILAAAVQARRRALDSKRYELPDLDYRFPTMATAASMHEYFQTKGKQQFRSDTIEDLLKYVSDERKADIGYFVGAMLLQNGNRDAAVRYLRSAVSSSNSNYYTRVLACEQLLQEKISLTDPGSEEGE